MHCGADRFGECIGEVSYSGMEMMNVGHREGGETLYLLDDLEVVHHNIEGMSREDTEGLLKECRLSVETVEELEFAISRATQKTSDGLLKLPLNEPIKETLWLSFHRKIFGKAFRWGGEYRRRDDIVVGRKEFVTAPSVELPTRMSEFEVLAQQSQTWLLKNASPEDPQYWRMLAELYFKFCEIHPFRDGNGRVSRLILSILLFQTLPEPVPLNWGLLRRRTRKTDRAFEQARLNEDLWPIAKLLYRVYCASVEGLNKKPPKCTFDGCRKV